MKTLFFTLLSTLIIFSAATVFANVESNPLRMKQLIYTSKIDAKLAFYQSKIYLIDSEYKILAEIGQEAVKKIAFLKANRMQLLNDMISSKVSLKQDKMNLFLIRKINSMNGSLQKYSLK